MDDTTAVVPRIPVADVTFMGPFDGMGDLSTTGPYLRLTVSTKAADFRFLLSIGAAEMLALEIEGILKWRKSL